MSQPANRNINDMCYNCGRQNVNHIAMYCSGKLQQYKRCVDQNCWAACRTTSDHLSMCASVRKPSEPLDDADILHRPVKRFTIESNAPIVRCFVGSTKTEHGPVGLNTMSIIAEDIEFMWVSANKFEITGPRTMYFRVLIAFEQSIIGRVDVNCESSSFVRVPVTMLEDCREVTKISQTVAILRVEPGEIEINAGDKCFVFQIAVNRHGTVEWPKFEVKTRTGSAN